jgi:hypothetical protein
MTAISAVFADSLADTARILPVLVPLYILLEYISHREVPGLVRRLRLGGGAGPLAGTLLGVIPQCSMSVLVTSLFASGHVSIGTLLATYLATSDEALPLLIAEGRHGRLVAVFVALKIVIAVVAGYLADAALHHQWRLAAPQPAAHQFSSHTEAASWREIVGHGLRHAVQIAAWVLVATFLLGLLLAATTGVDWTGAWSRFALLRVTAVTLFGMMPNCAASVAITEAFLRAGLPFGTTVAGLCAGAGFGPIVLFREVRARQALIVLGWLMAVAMIAGLAIDSLYPLSLEPR